MRQSTPDFHDQPESAFTELDQVLSRAEEVAAEDFELAASTPVRTALLSIGFGLAALLLAAAAGYSSAIFAIRHTDNRIQVLEGDLTQRRAAAAEQNARRDGELLKLRRLVCVFADRVQPQDQSVEEIRREYNCPSGIPTPTPNR